MDAISSPTCVLTKFEESQATLEKNGTDITVSVRNGSSELVQKSNENEIKTHLYKRRFFILGIFCLYSMSSAFQWIEYAIIMNIIMKYYSVSELTVSWTSMIYMLAYIPLMFVATWMLDHWGLRRVLLFGSVLNAVGALIKIGSVSPDLFVVTFIGQTVAACAQSFVLEIPPKIASLWFGPSEVSTATAIGVFGNQLGVALGFLIPPILVPDSNNEAELAAGLRILFISSAALCTIVVFLIFFVIKDKPDFPASKASAQSDYSKSNFESRSSSLAEYKSSIVTLMKNSPYILLLISYGVNTGTYYAVSTLINLIMSEFHKDAVKEIGEIGLTMVVAGLAGSVICGFFLDRTKLYKITTVVIYILSVAFMFLFTFTLQLPLWVSYITFGLLGFFMTGYLPIGFEFAAEITYPVSEATSSGILNVSAQVFGIIFTMAAQELKNSFNALAANLFMSFALLVGAILTVLIKEDLKRQTAERTEKTKSESQLLQAPNGINNENDNIDVESDAKDEKLMRLASASSCYSTGGQDLV